MDRNPSGDATPQVTDGNPNDEQETRVAARALKEEQAVRLCFVTVTALDLDATQKKHMNLIRGLVTSPWEQNVITIPSYADLPMARNFNVPKTVFSKTLLSNPVESTVFPCL